MASKRLAELAELLGLGLVGKGDLEVRGLAELDEAGADCIAPAYGRNARQRALASGAGAVVSDGSLGEIGRPQLVADDPRAALAALIPLFFESAQPKRPGVDPHALVDSSAIVDPTAHIGPFCVLEAEVRIEPGVEVLAFSYIGAGVRIGAGSRVGPRATLLAGSSCGPQTIIGSGAVLGGDGFGFLPQALGWVAMPSVGRVRLGRGVRVGANCCIDRGTLGETVVADGVKIDNLVQVAHNCKVGANALICALSGLAGSVRVGVRAIIGGHAGVADHRELGDGAEIAGHAGVIGDVPAGQRFGGYPARPHRQWLRQVAWLGRLEALAAELRAERPRDRRGGPRED